MINNYILEELNLNKPENLEDFENCLKEICQKIILYALSNTSFFKNVAFYGGTCLRIFHGLNRFSEDLDFQVINENVNVDLNLYMSKCITTLESFGLKAIVFSKDEYDIGEVRRRYIKISHFEIANDYFGNISMNKEKLISIKIEVSTVYIHGAKYEMNLLKSPTLSYIYCFNYSSLFAGKLNALLTRNWRHRTKGRDYFDYVFYLSHNIKVNFEYLKNKLCYSLKTDTSSYTIDTIKQMLVERFQDSNLDSIKKDIIPFVNKGTNIDFINKDILIDSIKFIESE